MTDETRKDGPDTKPIPIGDQIEQLSRAVYLGFERINERFDNLEARFDKLEARMDNLEKGFDRLEIQVSKLGYKLDALNDSLLEMKGEFRVFEKRLYLLEERPS